MAVRLPMNLLLDTCALFALSNNTLSKTARSHLLTAQDAVISPVVVWEIAIKVKTGKLTLPVAPLIWVDHMAKRHSLLLQHNLDIATFCHAAALPLIHRDPFDRVLIATARLHNLVIFTSDRIIATYPGIQVVW